MRRTPAPDAPPLPRWIEYVPLDELPEDPRNPKAHELDEIKRSLRRLGVIDVVTRDERTGRLISGHGRKTSLVQMHADGEAPPDGMLVADGGGWQVPVTCGWSSANDDEAAVALVTLNRAGELGGWQPQPLADLLSDLAAREVDLDGSGYTGADLDLLLAGLRAPDVSGSGSTDPDDEWKRMPDFEQEDRQSVAAVHVHFASEADAERFTREILGLSGKLPRSTWWPASDGHVGSDQKSAWVSTPPAADPVEP